MTGSNTVTAMTKKWTSGPSIHRAGQTPTNHCDALAVHPATYFKLTLVVPMAANSGKHPAVVIDPPCSI